MAEIQFSRGVKETVVPEVRITQAKSGGSGVAYFRFESPSVLNKESTEEITGMYLVDEEGEIVSREVKGKFVNGRPTSVEATLNLNSQDEWDRFMRFMERYGAENGLGFTKA
ncbi:MAG: photosystem II reaction center protein Psb28 [Cyanobacteria bacterium RI_101]|jgi:photosystem II protein|nr:photosystem II reaction center protein Psb28 [Cyanobacteria bacterium RI_101]